MDKGIKEMRNLDKAIQNIEVGARMKTLRQLQNLMEAETDAKTIRRYQTSMRVLRNQVRQIRGELGSQKD